MSASVGPQRPPGSQRTRAPNVELERIPGVELSAVGARFAPTSFANGIRYGKGLCGALRYGPWWVGDWLVWIEDSWLSDVKGKKEYGVKYKTALELTGLEVGTLMNLMWVARVIEFSRRREELSWSHHGVVCGFRAEEQDRFLDLAVKHGWTRAELRKELRRDGKQESDEPAIDVGFIPTAYTNELRRGWQSDVDRFGPVITWEAEVREGWKRALKVPYELYQLL